MKTRYTTITAGTQHPYTYKLYGKYSIEQNELNLGHEWHFYNK